MSLSPLSQFISQLEAAGELCRISVPVEPVLEIAAVTNRICKSPGGGTALLFENPTGSGFPVATNLFGSRERVCRALGITNLGELTGSLSSLLDRIPDPDISSLDLQITALPEFSRFVPHAAAETDPALIPMEPPDLGRFPFLQSWPEDGSVCSHPRYITLPQVVTTDPDGGTRNCGVYRVQIRGEREAAIQWKAGSGAARHAELYRLKGRAMPVAIVLGGDPAVLFSALFPLPGNLDELTFAGFLRGSPLVTVPCLDVQLRVPSGAEVVIEGYVEPDETVIEGPFGNHTGFYAPAAPAALMRITAIRHRRDAVIPATVVGPPPMEDCWMAEAWERLQLSFLQKLEPSIKDIRYPSEWVFHQCAVISIKNPQPGMVRDLSARLWALPWFRLARILLFVSAESESVEFSRVSWKAINVTDFTDDIFYDSSTGRVAVDATGVRIPLPEVKDSVGTTALVDRRWKEYGVA